MARRRWFSFRPALTLRGRKFKGLRGFAGKPFHPPLTDVPIGAYVIATVLDVISWLKGDSTVGEDLFRAATYVMIAGAVVSLPTALTGFWDWWKSMTPGTQAWRTANAHMAIMLTVTAIVILNVIVRLGEFDDARSTSTFVAVLTVIIGGLVSVGATYGGSLVYDYEFNVEQDNGYVWEPSEEDRFPGQPGHPG